MMLPDLLYVSQFLRLIPLLLVFVVAAWYDYKFGVVPNWVWLYAPVGACLSLAELYFFYPELWLVVLPVMVGVSLFSFFLFGICDYVCVKLRCASFLFGGADSKALIVLALCMPLSPCWSHLFFGIYPLLAFVVGTATLFVVQTVKARKIDLQVKGRLLPYVLFGMFIVLL